MTSWSPTFMLPPSQIHAYTFNVEHLPFPSFVLLSSSVVEFPFSSTTSDIFDTDNTSDLDFIFGTRALVYWLGFDALMSISERIIFIQCGPHTS